MMITLSFVRLTKRFHEFQLFSNGAEQERMQESQELFTNCGVDGFTVEKKGTRMGETPFFRVL